MRGMQGETTQTNSTSPKVANATHERITASRATSMTAHEPVIRLLRTSLWPLIVFAAYAALTLFTWVVFCLASTRLVGTKQDYMHNRVYRKELISLVTKHSNFIRAAQIVQAVTALLTIPITSAICSMALVAFIQTGSLRTRMSLRQTMALADQGWISPKIWTKVFKVGSLPLYLAFGLTLLGMYCAKTIEKQVLTCLQEPLSRSYSSLWLEPHPPGSQIRGPRHPIQEFPTSQL
jgi:hypothetical protein